MQFGAIEKGDVVKTPRSRLERGGQRTGRYTYAPDWFRMEIRYGKGTDVFGNLSKVLTEWEGGVGRDLQQVYAYVPDGCLKWERQEDGSYRQRLSTGREYRLGPRDNVSTRLGELDKARRLAEAFGLLHEIKAAQKGDGQACFQQALCYYPREVRPDAVLFSVDRAVKGALKAGMNPNVAIDLTGHRRLERWWRTWHSMDMDPGRRRISAYLKAEDQMYVEALYRMAGLDMNSELEQARSMLEARRRMLKRLGKAAIPLAAAGGAVGAGLGAVIEAIGNGYERAENAWERWEDRANEEVREKARQMVLRGDGRRESIYRTLRHPMPDDLSRRAGDDKGVYRGQAERFIIAALANPHGELLLSDWSRHYSAAKQRLLKQVRGELTWLPRFGTHDLMIEGDVFNPNPAATELMLLASLAGGQLLLHNDPIAAGVFYLGSFVASAGVAIPGASKIEGWLSNRRLAGLIDALADKEYVGGVAERLMELDRRYEEFLRLDSGIPEPAPEPVKTKAPRRWPGLAKVGKAIKGGFGYVANSIDGWRQGRWDAALRDKGRLSREREAFNRKVTDSLNAFDGGVEDQCLLMGSPECTAYDRQLERREVWTRTRLWFYGTSFT